MMTEQQFDARVKQIEKEYAAHREGADATRDQELARLFVEAKASGCGQEWIAERMGWTHGRVSQRLLFGRFLRFVTTGNKSFSPPKPLTERRFRDNWSAVGRGHPKDTEDDRFARVLERLKTDTSDTPKNYGHLVKKPGIREAVIRAISAGKRLDVSAIAEVVRETVPDVGNDQISAAVNGIRSKPPRGMALDARHTGRTHKYRLVERKRPPAARIDPDAASGCAAEALPLIKECIDILRQPVVGRQVTLALDHLWRIEQMLSRLLVPGEVA
jgi:hypothetical protein